MGCDLLIPDHCLSIYFTVCTYVELFFHATPLISMVGDTAST